MHNATGKRVIILGTHSFVDGGTKVGSQYLAEGLATMGWQVAYVATASSLVDVWGRKRHPRLKRVWLDGQDSAGVTIAPGLTEFAFKAIFPAHRLFLRKHWQMTTFGYFLPAWVGSAVFDVCISDVTPNMVFLPWIKAKHSILRLNDWPAGFAHDLHHVVIKRMERGLRDGSFSEVWAVSNPLARYAMDLNPKNRVVLMPNGVDLASNGRSDVQPSREKDSAIYIGGLTAWLDLPLLHQVAALLPHWSIHIYGPGVERLQATAPNLHFHGAVGRAEVPALLASHEVGLIPFTNADDRMKFVERPLKFYEYVVTGLGVASTDHGALRIGMGDLARYGNSPEAFAQAIVDARQQSSQREPEFAQQFAKENAWPEVISKAEHRLNGLLQRHTGIVSMKPNKLLLYDYLQVAGGAERVTLTLAAALPDFQCVVSRTYADARPLLERSDAQVAELGNHWTRLLTRIPEAMFNFRVRAKWVDQAQVVFYSGFYAPLAVHRQRSGLRVYYCHTIPRFAYDLYEVSKLSYPRPLRCLFSLFASAIRWQYGRAIGCMDVVLVNSENVRARLQRHLGVDSQVVYPPVDTASFEWISDEGYYLSVARLTPNKRVDVIVKAFMRMPNRRLVVLSGGPELDRLKSMALGCKNIQFEGWQTEQSLRQWVGKAHAAIYLPVDEDFGMSPVECMAAGKPVIGVAEGGLLETVIPGHTGVLIHGQPTAEKLVAAMDELEAMDPSNMRDACEKRAAQFNETIFIEKMTAHLG